MNSQYLELLNSQHQYGLKIKFNKTQNKTNSYLDIKQLTQGQDRIKTYHHDGFDALI